MKEAMQHQKLLDTGLASSLADIARIVGVSRAKVTQMLNLLKLDEEIREFLLNLKETDGRLEKVTERRLRSMIRLAADEQRKWFWKLIKS